MKVAYSEKELINNVNFALIHSKRKEFQTEKYMIECDDMLVYYTISDGNIYLSAAADRYTNKSQDVGSPVCIGSVYPSKYLNNYLDVVNQRMIELIMSTKILNGVLNIQFFVDKNQLYCILLKQRGTVYKLNKRSVLFCSVPKCFRINKTIVNVTVI